MRLVLIALVVCIFACTCNNSTEVKNTETDNIQPTTSDTGTFSSSHDSVMSLPAFPTVDSTAKSQEKTVHSTEGNPGTSTVIPPVDTTALGKPKEQGLLNYNIPKEMKYRKAYRIRFAINRDTADKTIILSPTSTTSTIHTSSTMSVELIDPLPDEEKAFLITKDNADIQLVDKDEATEWIFTVVPISGGTHELQVVVSIIRDGNKKQVVYSSSVQVHATMADKFAHFFITYWQWIIGTLLLPFVIWLVNSILKKKGK